MIQIGKLYEPKARHNVEAWEALESAIVREGGTITRQLALQSLDGLPKIKPAVMLDYLIRYGWLEEVK